MISFQSIPAISVDDRLFFGTESQVGEGDGGFEIDDQEFRPGVPQFFQIVENIEHNSARQLRGRNERRHPRTWRWRTIQRSAGSLRGSDAMAFSSFSSAPAKK